MRRRPRLILAGVALAALACAPRPAEDTTPGPEEVPAVEEPATPPRLDWAIALHGGAGAIARDEIDAGAYRAALQDALDEAVRMLGEGIAALEVVQAVVVRLEDDPLFNAGRGAVLTFEGAHELDAAIMEGRTLSAGAVAGVRNVRNPVLLARKVMEATPHLLLSGAGADAFAREMRVPRVPQDYFTTERRLREWREARRGGATAGAGLATVGAVALDRYGNLAAATSTGGTVNKRWGRVGDVPLIGAGTWADNRSVAVSCTGRGEEIIRHAVAHDLAARLAYRGEPLDVAAAEIVDRVLAPGDGGLVAVDPRGNLALAFNTDGMFRAVADSAGRREVAIWRESAGATPDASP
jgi:L-asparaginase / beta-aspartyl-peptidase